MVTGHGIRPTNSKRIIRILTILLLLVVVGSGYLFYKYGRHIWVPRYYDVTGRRTVAEVVDNLKPSIEKRLEPHFKRAGLGFPPSKVALVAFKKEKKLELYGDKDGNWVYIRTYPILAASGQTGPKLKEGDKQVPEGVYQITGLNPNSTYYLSMLVNYPNQFDKEKAALDKRTNLGGDIYIHGKDLSAGCLAIGDKAIEELFTLVALVGMKNVKVVIAPQDFRREGPVKFNFSNISWLSELYDRLEKEVGNFPLPN